MEQQLKIRELYNKLIFKDDFKAFLAAKLEVKKETIDFRFSASNSIPKRHQERVLKYLEDCIESEKKITEIRVQIYKVV